MVCDSWASLSNSCGSEGIWDVLSITSMASLRSLQLHSRLRSSSVDITQKLPKGNPKTWQDQLKKATYNLPSAHVTNTKRQNRCRQESPKWHKSCVVFFCAGVFFSALALCFWVVWFWKSTRFIFFRRLCYIFARSRCVFKFCVVFLSDSIQNCAKKCKKLPNSRRNGWNPFCG